MALALLVLAMPAVFLLAPIDAAPVQPAAAEIAAAGDA
jgi:outer membrane lipoprotein-sorting protein